MAREKVDNKLNVVIGTKAQIVGDTTIPENSIIITTDEIGGYEPDGVTIVLNNGNELEVSKDLEVEWTKVVNKPTFSTVATTGSYNDLSGKPDLTEKLDKDFSALPNQASPLLTDVLAINRGTVAQKTTLGTLLAQVDAEIFVVVASLPTTGVVNKIYLVPKTTPEGQDGYDEYIWVNNAWELIGSVKLDLSNYYNKTEVSGLLSGKVDKNNAITAGTKAKITYDAKGLVTAGADLVASDIPQLAISKVTNLQSSLDNKVDKVTGKGLSTNDYTNIDKGKVALIDTSGLGDKYLADDGVYKVVSGGGGIDINDLPQMTQAEFDTGTATTGRVVSPKFLKDNINTMINTAIITTINGGF